MKWFLASVVVVLLLGFTPAYGQGSEDQYVRIFNLIQEGDSFENNHQSNQALAKYLEAQSALQRFQKIYPEWNAKVVSFRLNYVAAKIAALSAHVPAPGPGATPSPLVTPPATRAGALPASVDAQLNSLHDQVRQLQVDKIVLEAKLKESFSAQPATLDPSELARTQERLRSLQKENELLKVHLDPTKTNRAPGVDPKVLNQTQQALADANRKLGEQTEKAGALQKQLDSMIPRAWNATALEATKKALEDANRQLAQQKELAMRLGSEKETLQSRLKNFNADSDTAALRAENQLLKKQLADLRATPVKPGKGQDAARQFAEAQAQIAALESDREILRLEKSALESRVKQLTASGLGATRPAQSAATAPAGSKPEDLLRIKQLERERDDLQKKLEIANKDLLARNGKGVSSHVLDLENQLAMLRSRLEVFEARQVPYTAAELELFKRPEVRLVSAEPKAGKRSVKELPAGSAILVADAQRLFSARQLDKAEDKYLQVLRQDDKNSLTLANLAAIQLEREHLDDAEKHIKQAVALSPEDPYNLSILGQVKFRQEKYDEALDALSRAAKLDPQNAEIQNYLGITLSEKGLRGPAETALRRAVQLEPGYGNAHHNLAVIYLTQNPPLVELARWHYQKALAAGHPRTASLEKMFEGQKTVGIK